MTIIGIFAAIDTFWWVFVWLVYIPTNASDPYIIPIVWWWSNLRSTSAGLMAGSYLAQFLCYIIAFIELVAWFLYLGNNIDLFMLWIPLMGYWVSIIFYALPPLFALLHVVLPRAEGGLASVPTAANYSNDLMLIVVGITLWLATGVVHTLFAQRAIVHCATLIPSTCKCDKR